MSEAKHVDESGYIHLAGEPGRPKFTDLRCTKEKPFYPHNPRGVTRQVIHDIQPVAYIGMGEAHHRCKWCAMDFGVPGPTIRTTI